jgi:hypothetical protein
MCITRDFGNRHFREGLAGCLQDNRAVGNSRLVHRDVSNASWKQPADLSPWHGLNGLNLEQGLLLKGTSMKA